MCQTGRNGQCNLFRPFLHLPFYILLPHPVLSLGYLSQINLTRATIIMWISELILTTCVLPAGPGRERERERERETHTHTRDFPEIASARKETKELKKALSYRFKILNQVG